MIDDEPAKILHVLKIMAIEYFGVLQRQPGRFCEFMIPIRALGGWKEGMKEGEEGTVKIVLVRSTEKQTDAIRVSSLVTPKWLPCFDARPPGDVQESRQPLPSEDRFAVHPNRPNKREYSHREQDLCRRSGSTFSRSFGEFENNTSRSSSWRLHRLLRSRRWWRSRSRV